MIGNVGGRDSARDLQDLGRLLVARQRTGDFRGMVALHEPHAALDDGDGRFIQGSETCSCDGFVAAPSGRETCHERPPRSRARCALRSVRS